MSLGDTPWTVPAHQVGIKVHKRVGWVISGKAGKVAKAVQLSQCRQLRRWYLLRALANLGVGDVFAPSYSFDQPEVF